MLLPKAGEGTDIPADTVVGRAAAVCGSVVALLLVAGVEDGTNLQLVECATIITSWLCSGTTRIAFVNASHTSGVSEQDDEDQLTLVQVVAEWNVESVCLWLHEDVGVPEVVPRFQQRRCDGEMLLDLTESDLINDFGVKNRIHCERILNAIEAIKTGDEFSDEEEEKEVDNDEDDDEEEDDTDVTAVAASQRHARSSMGEGAYNLLSHLQVWGIRFATAMTVNACHVCVFCSAISSSTRFIAQKLAAVARTRWTVDFSVVVKCDGTDCS